MRLRLSIEPQAFAKRLAAEIVGGNLNIADAIESLTGICLESSVEREYGSRLKKAPRATVHPLYFPDRFVNLFVLSKAGYSTWYPEVRFATELNDKTGVTEVVTEGFEHGYVQYGGGINRDHRYFRKELRTQVNHTIRLNQVTIPPTVFLDSIDNVKKMGTIE